MKKLITGIHHITAITSDAQKNLDFYAGILGLRLVKKTVNFDSPDVYHLYYGDTVGTPGTIMTFFPFPDIARGRKGKGQLTVTSFSIAENAIDYWIKRFKKFHVKYNDPQQRFGNELYLSFEDYDGLSLELVANKDDSRKGYVEGPIPSEYAIKGFYGITLCEEGYEKTAGLLTTQLDHERIAEQGNRFRYSASGKPGDFVDVICSPDTLRGQGGAGTVHHVAFATANDVTQLEVREKLIKISTNITPVLDREYFHSVYFREPGGVLFEVATLPPGFTVDEELAHLGESLKLPPWQEKNRNLIEDVLPSIQMDLKRFKD